MPVQAQVRKIAGVGISAVCLLFVIIGLSTKRLYVGENTVETSASESIPSFDVTARCSFGIREYTVVSSYVYPGSPNGETTIDLFSSIGGDRNVDLWDYQQIENCYCNSRRRAAKKKLADTLKAAFAFLFLGLVVNSLQCVAFLVEVFWQPRPATRRAAIGGGVAMAVFYLIGFACAIAGPKAYVDFANASGLVSYRGEAWRGPYLVAKPGVSSALLITAWIGSLGTIALALLERYGETTPAEDGAAPSSISLGREPKGDLEAPAADEVPAAQGV